MKNMPEYVNVKIPKSLADEIDKVVELGLKGFRNRGEFVNSAIREFLKNFEEEIKEPRLKHFNIYPEENRVTLWDRKLKRLVDVTFSPKEPYVICEVCGRSDCIHVQFVLKIPKVVESLRARGWRVDEDEGKILYVPPREVI